MDWMFDNLPEWLVVTIICLFMIVVAAGLSVGVAYLGGPPDCSGRTQNIALESRWTFWGGCQIQISDGRWIPLDNWYWIEEK